MRETGTGQKQKQKQEQELEEKEEEKVEEGGGKLSLRLCVKCYVTRDNSLELFSSRLSSTR